MDVFIGTQCTFNKVEIIRNAVIEETGTPALTGQFQTCQSCLNCRSVWWLSSCNIIYVLLVCFLRYSPVSGYFTLLRPPYCAFYQTSWQLSSVEFCSTGPVWPICCVRHGRPRHSAAEVTDKLRHWRYCPQVVPVVPDQPYPVCPSWYGLIDHSSANTQIYGACGPSDVSALLQKVTGCLTVVADWMSANRLQLNSDKTVFMWLTSPHSQHRLPTSGPLIGSKVVSLSATVPILAFSSIKIWWWRPMCNRQHLAALPPCISCEAFVATYIGPSSIPLFLHSSLAGCTITTVSWSTCLSITSSVSSQSKMLQQGSFSTWDVVTTSPTCSSVFIGCARRSELHSRWRRCRIVHCMVPHHLTWRRHSHV